MNFLKFSEDIEELSAFKRMVEYTYFDREFSELYKSDKEKAIESIGLKFEDIDHAAALYDEFIKEKLGMREEVRSKSVPDNQRFAKWRNRQIRRCEMLYAKHQSDAVVHLAVAFELSRGCSIGCKFCGLNAGPLEKLFRATDENRKLWSDVMDATEKIVGAAAGQSSCYYGTEPLDNPDYEYYMEDWNRRFGRYGQITTAAATRNIERTRELLKTLKLSGDTIYRFSVRSIDEFRTIMREYTPEELLLVELIPQFEGAPGNAFAKVGRNVKNNEYSGSISCLSGFLINMCDQSIRLITPVEASAEYPLGQIEIRKEFFSDGNDFEKKMNDMISDMKTILSPSEILSMYDYLEYNEKNNIIQVSNKAGTYIAFETPGCQDIIIRILELLRAGSYTRKGIVEIIENEFPPQDTATLFYLINSFWEKGLIMDTQLYSKEE